MKNYPFILLLIFSLSLCVSCNEDDNKDLNYEELTLDEIQTDSYIFAVYEEVEEMTQAFIQGNGYPLGEGRTYATVTYPDYSTRVTINYVNFENENRASNFTLNGNIIVKMTANVVGSDFKREITFNNFNINGNKYSGQIVITKSALYTNKIKFESLKITYSDLTSYSRNGALFFTKTHGEESYEIWDDSYQITGSINGLNRSNISFSNTIINPVVKKMNYKYNVSGKMDLIIDKKSVFVDFGNNIPDNLVNLTINGEIIPNVILRN